MNSKPKMNFSHHSLDTKNFLLILTFPMLPIIPSTPKLIISSNATKPPCITAFPNEGVRPFINSSIAYPRVPAPKRHCYVIAKAPPAFKPPANVI